MKCPECGNEIGDGAVRIVHGQHHVRLHPAHALCDAARLFADVVPGLQHLLYLIAQFLHKDLDQRGGSAQQWDAYRLRLWVPHKLGHVDEGTL